VWGVRTYLLATVALLTLAIYVGGPARSLVQAIPGVGNSPIERTRVLIGLCVAVLAAIGLDAWMDDSTRRSVRADRLAWVVLGVLAVAGVALTVHWIQPVAPSLRPAIVESAVGAAVVIVAGAGLVAWRRRTRADIGGAVCVLAAIEGLFLVIPYWHRAETFYPHSPSLEALQALQGDDRVDGVGVQMTGTANYYGVRTVTGHAFHTVPWSDLLLAVDPHVFTTPTYTMLRASAPAAYDSKVLDRLAVRYLLVGRNVLLPGGVTATDAVDAPADRVLPAETWVSGPVQLDQLRGVGLIIGAPTDLRDAAPKLEIEVRDSAGNLIGRNEKTIPNHLEQVVEVAVATGEATGPGTVRMRLADSMGSIPLAPSGQAVFRAVNGDGSDDLEMVDAVPGGAIFRRPNALPRYRWASSSQVITDPDARVAALVAGVPTDTVVLNQPSGGQEGGAGSVVSVDDGDPDARTIVTRSDGPGFLVIADAFRHGWEVALDGRPAELLEADHALMAVAVPGGEHTVTLTFQSPGGTPALVLSLLGLAAMVVLLVEPRRRSRAGGAGAGDAHDQAHDEPGAAESPAIDRAVAVPAASPTPVDPLL
jgi:hypothetical protein